MLFIRALICIRTPVNLQERSVNTPINVTAFTYFVICKAYCLKCIANNLRNHESEVTIQTGVIPLQNYTYVTKVTTAPLYQLVIRLH